MTHYFIGNITGGPLPKEAFGSYTNSIWETVKAAARYFGPPDQRVITDFTAGRVTNNRDDILFGAVTVDSTFTGKISDWMTANRLNNYEKTHPNCYLFFQSTQDYTFPDVQYKLLPYFDEQLLNARLIFATLGTFWYDQWMARNDNSVQAQVKHKVIRVNVGCEWQHFAFREPVKRPKSQILHVSNLQWYKNPQLFLDSMKGVDTTLYIHSRDVRAKPGAVFKDSAGEPLPNVVARGPYNNSDPAFNSWVAETCDFWISTSRLDAQSTCVLEMCARGLVPLLTKEVGFDCPYAVYLTDDPVKNRAIISRAITMSASEYKERSIGCRQHVEKYHDWKDVYRTINECIALDQSGQRVGPMRGMEFS